MEIFLKSESKKLDIKYISKDNLNEEIWNAIEIMTHPSHDVCLSIDETIFFKANCYVSLYDVDELFGVKDEPMELVIGMHSIKCNVIYANFKDNKVLLDLEE